MKLLVNTHKKKFRFGRRVVPCAIGKNGWVNERDGREGDGKTPLGLYPVRYGLYRADRIHLPPTQLLMHALRPDDGWCDAPHDPGYNRPVMCPYPASCENLWRDSAVYDMIIVLGHNDSPPTPGLGSAIFLHIARSGYSPTQGCIAIAKEDMLALVQRLNSDQSIRIEQ